MNKYKQTNKQTFIKTIQNKYKIIDFIGKGKFGSVFVGENTHNLREKVAIKIEERNQPIHILRNETRILEYLSKNGIRTQIPQVFWFGNYEDKICLVMTYFVGFSLEKQIDNTISFDNKEIIMNHWIMDALDMLEKIHLLGVIHRDIKPEHFILLDTNKCKWSLIDFGFATFYLDQHIDGIDKKDDKKGEYIIGTPNYISINIHNGMKYKPIDDIWSLIYIYIRLLYPALFCYDLEEKNDNDVDIKEEYPLNHILNKKNQIRKRKKELFHSSSFWEKNSKIYDFIKILIYYSEHKNIPYNILRGSLPKT
jgi:serine/threonine protein kinase